MPIGHKDHGGVPVAIAVSLGRCHQPLDFGLRQVLAGAQVGVGEPLGRDCSFYGGWRDQLEVRLGHVFRSSCADDCSYNGPFTNSLYFRPSNALAIGGVASSKWTSRRFLWQGAALGRTSKTSQG